MGQIDFQWHYNKEKSNIQKHGISFTEAKTCFFDANARLAYDKNHSDSEERFILLGLSTQANLLIVVHCFRDRENTIRIISARKANKKEVKQYQGFKNER